MDEKSLVLASNLRLKHTLNCVILAGLNSIFKGLLGYSDLQPQLGMSCSSYCLACLLYLVSEIDRLLSHVL
jgi:hypothetical protein